MATENKEIKNKPVPVFFIGADTRAFLLEYLQVSPAGQYSPAAINNIVAALENAGRGTYTLSEPDDDKKPDDNKKPEGSDES